MHFMVEVQADTVTYILGGCGRSQVTPLSSIAWQASSSAPCQLCERHTGMHLFFRWLLNFILLFNRQRRTATVWQTEETAPSNVAPSRRLRGKKGPKAVVKSSWRMGNQSSTTFGSSRLEACGLDFPLG